MSNIPAAEIPSVEETIFLQGWLSTATTALLLYDYILTFDSEINLLWRGSGVIVFRVAFFILRASILGNAVAGVIDSSPPDSDATIKGCTSFNNAYLAFFLAGTFIVAAVTAVRTYAVSGGRWSWTITASALALANFSLTVLVSVKPLYSLIELQSSWICEISGNLSVKQDLILTLVLLICNVLADVVVIVATWVRTFRIVRLQARRQTWKQSIAWILMRDGTIYFVAVFVVNLLLGIIGVRFDTISWLAGLMLPLQLVLLNRLLINLREASQLDIYIGSQDPSIDDGHFDDTTRTSTVIFNRADDPDDEESLEQPVADANDCLENCHDTPINTHEQPYDGLGQRTAGPSHTSIPPT